mmetsp:Transcript_23080/g.46068  ORF Transcript_23080/g.46068 Transcript_23080/m.46068 type:complete len:293 (+) Transcript_23080:147-1025(+)
MMWPYLFSKPLIISVSHSSILWITKCPLLACTLSDQLSRAGATRSGRRFRPYATSPLSPPRAGRQNPEGLPENYLTEAFPAELLRAILGMLPASHRFVAPVSHWFRRLYWAAVVEKSRQSPNRTYVYSLSSEAALQLYMKMCKAEGGFMTSVLGAACGRTDWVERGGTFDEHVCAAAARCGRTEVLRWLRARGCPWDEGACWEAAEKGRLGTLQWLRKEGCPWDSSACRAAARGGHFEVLKWAIENGCPPEGSWIHGVTDPDFLEWFRGYRGGALWERARPLLAVRLLPEGR